jgi:hypothetical protein
MAHRKILYRPLPEQPEDWLSPDPLQEKPRPAEDEPLAEQEQVAEPTPRLPRRSINRGV